MLGLGPALRNEAAHAADGQVAGNPLDAALWAAPDAPSLATGELGPGHYERLGMLPFDHERQLASALVHPTGGEPLPSRWAHPRWRWSAASP